MEDQFIELNKQYKILAVIIVICSMFISFMESGSTDSIKDFKQFFDIHVNTNMLTSTILSPIFQFIYYLLSWNSTVLNKYDKIIGEILEKVDFVEYFYVFLILLKICIITFVNVKLFNIFFDFINLFVNKSNPMVMVAKICLMSITLYTFQLKLNSILSDYKIFLKWLFYGLIWFVVLAIAYMLFKAYLEAQEKKLKATANIQTLTSSSKIGTTEEVKLSDKVMNFVKKKVNDQFALYINVAQMLSFLFIICIVLQILFSIFNKIFRHKQKKSMYAAKDKAFINVILTGCMIPFLFSFFT
jgi:hypothetical protein